MNKYAPKKPNVLKNDNDYNKFMKATEAFEFEIPMKLALIYGLRQDELMVLEWPIVCFDKEQIEIKRGKADTRVREKSGNRVRKEKTESRIVPFLPGVKELLLRLKEQIEQNKAKHKYRYKDSDLLSVDSFGGLPSIRKTMIWLELVCDKAELPRISFDYIRQNRYYRLLNSDMPRSEVHKFMGFDPAYEPKTKYRKKKII